MRNDCVNMVIQVKAEHGKTNLTRFQAEKSTRVLLKP